MLTGLITWQCSKQTIENGNTNSSSSLKSSLTTATNNLNTAITQITETKGYQLLSISNVNTTQSASIETAGYQDSITLATIAGIYAYKPVTYNNWCFQCYNKLFTKTGTSTNLVVELPSAKVFYPQRFHLVTPADTSLPNNFVITATNYHYYFSYGFLYDYNLVASLAISDTAIGNLAIASTSSSYSNYKYASSYNFANGDKISVSVTSGDTASSSVTLSNASSTLFMETVNAIQTTGSYYRERQYILEVGNVEFTRNAGSDSITVYVGGVLQNHAKVQIIDKSTSGGINTLIVGRNRDLQVTFNDSTTTTLSTLLGPSVTALQSLVTAMQNLYFATDVVDYIAESIYKNQTE